VFTFQDLIISPCDPLLLDFGMKISVIYSYFYSGDASVLPTSNGTYMIEQQESAVSYYALHFAGRDHSVFVGSDIVLGPILVCALRVVGTNSAPTQTSGSSLRELRDAFKDKVYDWKILIRTRHVSFMLNTSDLL
jgi:hypothetical protein